MFIKGILLFDLVLKFHLFDLKQRNSFLNTSLSTIIIIVLIKGYCISEAGSFWYFKEKVFIKYKIIEHTYLTLRSLRIRRIKLIQRF